MYVYILTGTPGSKASAADKIAKHLRDRGLTVGIGSVEDELVNLFSDGSESNPKKHPLVSLIGERTQVEIKDRWPEAYKKAYEKACSDSPDIGIIIAGMEYYRSETYEFYSPIEAKEIQKLNQSPQSILTLIDDAYEVYYRLSQPGMVFDIQELITRRLTHTREQNSGDLRKLYKNAINIAIGSLQRVLVWREKEIACGANLARTLGCEHAVLAVKHPVDTGVRLLLGSTSASFPAIGPSTTASSTSSVR